MSAEKILVSWVSYGNDPFERDHEGYYKQGNIPGPTIELLTNPHSPYQGKISRAFLFFRDSHESPDRSRRKQHALEAEVFDELRRELGDRLPGLKVEACPWKTSEAPTSHEAVFRFIVEQLRRIRGLCGDATLVVNLSPGTPQMHTTMLLALQAGYAEQPVEAVQGFRPRERKRPDQILEDVPWNLLGRLNRIESAERELESGTVEWSLEHARSPRLSELMRRIRQYGRLPFPVLILGNRGSGKRSVAELIRAAWLTANMRGGHGKERWKFRINCAALSGEVLRVELFGSVKGSYSGAIDKEGLLKLASGDCVFLDEFHHMEKEVQAELLVPLESHGEFRPVGGKEPIESNFRLITASNLPLKVLREDRLLPDLYDRISDFILDVPDLHPDCRDDLPGIWDVVVRDACREVARVSSEKESPAKERAHRQAFREHEKRILETLVELRLPGNWRDLQRLARRLIARGLGPNQQLELSSRDVQRTLEELAQEEGRTEASPGTRDEVPQVGNQEFQLPSLEECHQAAVRALKAGERIPHDQLAAEWEWRLLEGALQAAGSQRKAAALLGLAQSTFRERYEERKKQVHERPAGSEMQG
jgi:transcriptional regulator with AAA-type ATPase domain